MPVYPGAPEVSIEPHRLIRDGYRYNSYAVRLFNHCGTHVDAPRHVYEDGPQLSDFQWEELVFDHPIVVTVPAEDGELITSARLADVLEPNQHWDFVAIRTEFARFRDSDPQRFSRNNPGLSPEAARWLLEAMPAMRGLGLDVISVSAGGKLAPGWEAHRILLDPARGRRLIVEDMRLPEALPPLQRLWIVPLIVEGTDSSWCSVVVQAG